MWKSLDEVVGMGLTNRKVWYNLKYDQRLMIHLQSDADVRSLMRGNDAQAYQYIAGVGGPHARLAKLTE